MKDSDLIPMDYFDGDPFNPFILESEYGMAEKEIHEELISYVECFQNILSDSYRSQAQIEGIEKKKILFNEGEEVDLIRIHQTKLISCKYAITKNPTFLEWDNQTEKLLRAAKKLINKPGPR